MQAENEQLRQQNQWLLEQLKLARHHRFGASSEKVKPEGIEQLNLFNEVEAEADPSIPEPELKEIKAYRRRKAGQVGTARLPEDIPVEIIEHELPEEERSCPECGENLHTMGKEIREELKLVPAHAVLLRHVRHTYACRRCERHNDHVPIVKATMPNPVIKGSFASPEAIAHIACEKFVMGSPLYRQEQDWARKGIPLSRQTMSSWLIRATQDWLFPLYDALRIKLLAHEVLHSDETGVQVLQEPGKSPQSKSYMWMYRTSGDARHPIVLYEYQPGRHARHPKAFLQDFHGFLHADGYEGYHDLPQDISVVGCWAHVRRKFDEALKAIPASAQANSPPMEAIKQIGQLYKLEEEFQKLSPDDKFKARQKSSKPLVDAFFDWCKAQNALPKSHFGNAIKYARNQRFWLKKYLLDGRLEIDNNRAERSIKPFVIGRKNWLFCNTQDGAKVSAVLYSMIETAKENGLNPFDYLAFVFRTAPNLDLAGDSGKIELLLPWNFVSPEK
ncbi:IS66 family transposase [Christensenellaceae bacterium OttesenSCG-928-L17]|nr:IS66 family transposase [Christensenellaceae bacterium OttesenSCG-928-L17]